jgi:hypothetical protein
LGAKQTAILVSQTVERQEARVQGTSGAVRQSAEDLHYVYYKAPMAGQRLFFQRFFGQWPKAGPEALAVAEGARS